MICKKNTIIIDLREASNEDIAGIMNVLVQLEAVLPQGYKLNTRLKQKEESILSKGEKTSPWNRKPLNAGL